MALLDSLRALLDSPGSSRRDKEDPLAAVVREHMPDADDGARRVVAAIAGLFACVAYADQKYTDDEAALIRAELGRIHGLTPRGVDAVCAILAARIASIGTVGDQFWVRDLRDHADRDQRLEILDVLVDLAAADSELTHDEANYLRRLSTALGLSQDEYNASQARHRDKLKLLR